MKTLIIAALFALVSTGHAQPPGGQGMGRGPGQGYGPGRGERMMEMLDLDSATALKIGKLRDEHQKERIALRAKLETARVEFRAAMRKDPVDEKAALARQKEVSSIREQLQASALEHRFAVEKLLTPEQRKTFRAHRGMGGMMDGGRMGDGTGFGRHGGRAGYAGRGGHGGRGCDCGDMGPMRHGRGSWMDRDDEDDRDDD